MITVLIVVVAILVVDIAVVVYFQKRRRSRAKLLQSHRRSRRRWPHGSPPRTEAEQALAAPTALKEPPSTEVAAAPPAAPATEVAPPRLGERLTRARQALATTFASVRGRGRVNAQLFDELEEALILADVGVATTNRLLDPLRAEFRGQGDGEAVLAALKQSILELFSGDDPTLQISPERPAVWLFVGVNGVGKTTTIGKLAKREIDAGRSIVLAAGDTFRAAAGEQLGIWAERTKADIVQGADGADPSSVIFDAIAARRGRGTRPRPRRHARDACRPRRT